MFTVNLIKVKQSIEKRGILTSTDINLTLVDRAHADFDATHYCSVTLRGERLHAIGNPLPRLTQVN